MTPLEMIMCYPKLALVPLLLCRMHCRETPVKRVAMLNTDTVALEQ